jgi:hypothetical protein
VLEDPILSVTCIKNQCFYVHVRIQVELNVVELWVTEYGRVGQSQSRRPVSDIIRWKVTKKNCEDDQRPEESQHVTQDAMSLFISSHSVTELFQPLFNFF